MPGSCSNTRDYVHFSAGNTPGQQAGRQHAPQLRGQLALARLVLALQPQLALRSLVNEGKERLHTVAASGQHCSHAVLAALELQLLAVRLLL